MQTIVHPVLTVHVKYSWRMWFYGDAAKQRAMTECKSGESVYPVEIELSGLRSNKLIGGWAVGEIMPKN